MNDKPEIKPKGITPLKHICMTIGELPSSYLETMTYYEMLLWFTKFLQERMIPALDNNALAVEELQHLFIELQTYVNDYFDNLDVQDEINNKLDQMLEDGVLEQIIEQYIQSSAIWGFDNVNDMKEATNLINGSFAKTLGYYTANDGGGATYKITDEESETEYQEELESGLFATLIIKDYVTPEMFGAKGDGETDDTIPLTLALQSDYEVLLNNNYLLNDHINCSSKKISGKGTIILKEKSTYSNETHASIEFVDKNNIKIEGISIVATKNLEAQGTGVFTPETGEMTSQWNGLLFRHCSNVDIKNLIINNCDYGILVLPGGYSSLYKNANSNYNINNITFNETKTCILAEYCNNINVDEITHNLSEPTAQGYHTYYFEAYVGDVTINNDKLNLTLSNDNYVAYDFASYGELIENEGRNIIVSNAIGNIRRLSGLRGKPNIIFNDCYYNIIDIENLNLIYNDNFSGILTFNNCSFETTEAINNKYTCIDMSTNNTGKIIYNNCIFKELHPCISGRINSYNSYYNNCEFINNSYLTNVPIFGLIELRNCVCRSNVGYTPSFITANNTSVQDTPDGIIRLINCDLITSSNGAFTGDSINQGSIEIYNSNLVTTGGAVYRTQPTSAYNNTKNYTNPIT